MTRATNHCRVGVISDTHVPAVAPGVPASVLRGLEGVDLILHAGDLVDMRVLEVLGGIAETWAVRGNTDSAEVRAALPEQRIVEAGGFRIGLTHGSGAPFGLAERVQGQFKAGTVEAIVFGHSHEPWEDWRAGVLRFNPGSPTDRRFTAFRSYGILALGETIEATIVRLD